MNLLADESVDRQIVEALRQAGHVVLYVLEFAPGIDDQAVLEKANQTDALLITADKDFGELVFRRNLVNKGVILIRLAGLLPEEKGSIVASTFQEHNDELRHSFAVISPGMVRIRPKIKTSPNPL